MRHLVASLNPVQTRRLLIDASSCLREILTLSSSGLGFRIEKNISEQIQLDRKIKQARLFLSDNAFLNCELEVKATNTAILPSAVP